MVLKAQGRAAGGRSYKARVVMEGLNQLEEGQEGLSKKTVTLTNTGQCQCFVRITSDSSTARYLDLDLSATALILAPGQTKAVTISQVGEVGALSEVLKLTIVRGPELARLVMKKPRKLAGGAKLCDSPAELGFNFTEELPGENIKDLQEEFKGQLTAVDVKHFFKKTTKNLQRIFGPLNRLEMLFWDPLYPSNLRPQDWRQC